MSTDYGEKERQFLAALQAETGRDLTQWMAAIDAEALAHRNEIIDWLRRHGFMFSKASWLERIHNNGGKPIYGEGASPRPQTRARPRSEPRAIAPRPSAVVVPFAPRDAMPLPRHKAAAPENKENKTDKAALDELLAKAKAFRPLASFILAEIERSVPGAVITPHAAHVAIARARDFAVLAISPRELRLGLALGARPHDAKLQAAKFPPAVSPVAPSITHMLVLTDARQVDDALRAVIRNAAETAG